MVLFVFTAVISEPIKVESKPVALILLPKAFVCSETILRLLPTAVFQRPWLIIDEPIAVFNLPPVLILLPTEVKLTPFPAAVILFPTNVE